MFSVISRLYKIVKIMFPGLPDFEPINPRLSQNSRRLMTEDDTELDISSLSLLMPIIGPKIHDTLYMLYKLRYVSRFTINEVFILFIYLNLGDRMKMSNIGRELKYGTDKQTKQFFNSWNVTKN